MRQLSFIGVGLSLSLTLALTATCAQPMYAQCTDCLKHTGTEPGLLPRNGTSSTDASSNSLWGGTSNTTLQTGTESTMLQTGTQSTMLQTGTQNMLLQGGTARNTEETNIEILIDCSQSMKEKLGGMLSSDQDKDPKMEMAKRVLEQTMTTIPADVNVGLRVFGQSFHNDPFLDCQQTALLVPIGTHNRRAIVERIRSMRPYGLTPLTYALEQAASDLSQFGGKKQLILISDGAETCGLDPCAMVHQLTARGINMKIDIVGLG
ncbi:MAG TPA: VWA domain-containing protein, partial [Candidatus Obscuribacterales bacterium]